MFMLLFLQEDSKNQDQYVCYYQVSSFRCITTSTSPTDGGIFSLFYWLIVGFRWRSYPSCLTIYLYICAFLHVEIESCAGFGWARRPSAVHAFRHWVRLLYFLDWFGLTSLRWLLFLDVSFYPYFKHFSFLYKISLIMQLCQQFFPYSHRNTHHTIDGSLFSPLTSRTITPYHILFSTISYLFYYCGFTLCPFLTWHPLFLISFPYSNGTTRTYWYWLVFGWRVQCINYGFLLIFSAPSFTTFYPASCAVVYHRGFLLSEGECQAVMWKNMFYWNSVLSCVGQVLSRSIFYPLLRKYGWQVSLS